MSNREREHEVEMRRKFAEVCAEAMRKGEIKKPNWKDFIVGYCVDDDGNPVEPEGKAMTTLGHFVDDNGDKVEVDNS